jgi:uncharacterized protein
MRRRPLAVLIVLSVFITLVVLAHRYFAVRLIAETGLPEPWATLGNGAIALLGLLLFAHPVADRSLGPSVGRVLGWPAYLWLGTSFYLLLGLGASDVALLVSGSSGIDIAQQRAWTTSGLVFTVVAWGLCAGLRAPQVKRVRLEIEGWPAALAGYRIVQISDIHIGSLIRRPFAERMVAACNALDPDVVAITGDLVDGSVRHLGEHVAPLADLRARDGVFFVTGNHDHYSGADRWVHKLEELGVQVLRNRRVPIDRGGARIELAGVDDLSSRRLDASSGYDLRAALAGWDGNTPLVLLAHHPATFDEARPRGVHLQLSGHTHGGQIWPFTWLVRLQTRYVAGVYRQGRSHLYVSRGTGFWGPPMRVLAPAEVTELTLHPAAGAA